MTPPPLVTTFLIKWLNTDFGVGWGVHHGHTAKGCYYIFTSPRGPHSCKNGW